MLIEQIIEFEWRRPSPLAVHVLLLVITTYFLDKTKICKDNLWVQYYLLLKNCRRQCALLPPIEPNHLQNLAPRCKILNMLWT